MITTTGRNNGIAVALDDLEREDIIEGWYTYSPGDGWRRWVLAGVPGSGLGGSRTFSTREVESFITGAQVSS